MNKETAKKNRYIVPAVHEAFRVLFCLAEYDGSFMSLNEVCRRVDIHKSKAFSILNTLQEFGVILRNSEGKGYALGPGLVSLSRGFLDKLSTPRIAEPVVAELSKKTGHTVVFGMRVDKYAFVVAKHEGEQHIAITVRLGQRFPLTYGSHGKAIAAMLSREDLENLLNEEKPYFHGDPSAFNRKRLEQEMEDYLRTGYATDFGEMAPGIATVASAVMGPKGAPIGYVVVFGFLSVEAADKLGPLVAEAGQALSEQLGGTAGRIGAFRRNGY